MTDLDEWVRNGWPEDNIRVVERKGRTFHPPIVDWRYFNPDAKKAERLARRWLRAGKPRWYDRFVGLFRRRGGA